MAYNDDDGGKVEVVVLVVEVVVMTMDRSATVNHDHLYQYIVNFNPIN